MPKEGASSWMPPESVSTRRACCKKKEQAAIGDRLNQIELRDARQVVQHRPAHIRVRVHREQEGKIREIRGQPADGFAYAEQRGAEAFPPMAGHQHKLPGMALDKRAKHRIDADATSRTRPCSPA